MQFFIVALALVASVMAQNIELLNVEQGLSFTFGQKFTLEIAQPVPPTPVVEIGVAVALKVCEDNTDCGCDPNFLGVILAVSDYHPVESNGSHVPYATVDVTFPTIGNGSTVTPGALCVYNSFLSGAGPTGNSYLTGVSVNVGPA